MTSLISSRSLAGDDLNMYFTTNVFCLSMARAPVGPRLIRNPGTTVSGPSLQGLVQLPWFWGSLMANALFRMLMRRAKVAVNFLYEKACERVLISMIVIEIYLMD